MQTIYTMQGKYLESLSLSVWLSFLRASQLSKVGSKTVKGKILCQAEGAIGLLNIGHIAVVTWQ